MGVMTDKDRKRHELEWLRKTTQKPPMEDLLVDLFEVVLQAKHDLCGEQREYHIPRLNRVMLGMMSWFPADAAAALERATQ
jgi:hypothetical protein